jgi:hypothetical protein
MMDYYYGKPTDPDCATALVYGIYLSDGSVSYYDLKSFVNPEFLYSVLTFHCGGTPGTSLLEVTFSNLSYWGISYSFIFNYYGTIALNCASCQLTGVAPSASNLVPSGGTITYLLGAPTSTTVVTYVETPTTCNVSLKTTYSISIVGGVGTKNWLLSLTKSGLVITL